MAEAKNKETPSKNENPLELKNIFLMLPKIELKIPFFNQHPKKQEALVKKEEEIEIPKPPSLFMGHRQKLPPPLEFEAEECVGRSSNPIVLWQVYAIGGFFLAKWIWARWKERKDMGAKKESSDNEQAPADDNSQ
ncbi:uncharacterized protein LOC111294250 [Durio zibethinus]|uniref:Uncharacterized protein LOC111294250 n=1 Tax=Durio zibethinus TaxID=66656 RepID=A0A6P5YSV2_DURZI|nr:uncharacterized protein LOC111294250 [Durio zibethinus]